MNGYINEDLNVGSTGKQLKDIKINADNIASLFNLAIEECDLTANDGYVKFKNGFLINWKRVAFDNVAVTSSWGSLYDSALIQLGNWKKVFENIPATSLLVQSNSGLWTEGIQYVSKTSAGRVWLCRATSQASVSGYITIIGIGV